MSLNDITEKIINDANKQRREIQKRTQSVVTQMEQELSREREKAKLNNQDNLRLELKKAQDKIVSITKQEALMEKEKFLREEVNSIFNSNYQWLLSLNSDDYIKILEKLIRFLSLTDSATITCYTPLKRQKEAEKALSVTKFRNADLHTVEDVRFKGGLKFENEKEFHDLSFETLVSTIQTDKEDEVYRLFLTK